MNAPYRIARAYSEGFDSVENVAIATGDDPSKQLRAVESLVRELAAGVMIRGELSVVEFGGRLQDIFERTGMIVSHGQDRLQQLLTDALKNPLVLNGTRTTPSSVERHIPADGRTEHGSSRAVPTYPDLWPQPLGEDAYHGVAGELLRSIEPSTEADSVAILLQLLAAFGNVCGRHCYYQVEGDRHLAVLWPVLVGRTAKGRKGTSWGRVREVMSAVDPRWAGERIVTGLSTGEGILFSIRDAVVNGDGEEIDSGVADKRLLVLEPEFASPLRHIERPGNILSSTIRALWDTGTSATLTKNSPMKATGATVTVIGHITDEELRRYLTRTERANGLANRFLFALVRRSKLLPFGGPQVQFEPFIAQLKEAVARAWPDHRMGWTDAAAEIWEGIYGDLSAGKAGLAGAVTSRAETQVVRLAIAYALLDGAPEIDAPHLKAALAVWQYCDESARIIFGTMTGNEVADEILRMLLAAPEGMSRKEISMAFSRHLSSQTIATAVRDLAENGLARSETRQTGGRPEERWYANKAN
jgi:hypothetical protein